MKRIVLCRVSGGATSRFFVALKVKGVDSYNIVRREQGYEFEVDKKHFIKTVEIAKELCYNIEVLTDSRVQGRTLATRIIGIVLATILMTTIPVVAWSKIGKIEITGDTVYESEILSKLDELGVQIGCSKYGINLADVSAELSQINGVSRVQATYLGTLLRVSVRDSVLPDDRVDIASGNAIVATFDATVTKIAVTAGTAVVAVGDVVTKGQILVEGTEGEGSERRDVVPRAVIYGETWSTAHFDFVETETVFERTGSVSRQVDYFLGNVALTHGRIVSPFDCFEQDTVMRSICGFVPLSVQETFFYETQAVLKRHDYDAEHAEIESSLMGQARKTCPNGMVVREYITTTKEENYTRIRGVVVISTIISGAII